MSDFNSRKRGRSEDDTTTSSPSSSPSIPQFDISLSTFETTQVTDAYEHYQAVHLKNVPLSSKGSAFGWKKIGELFDSLSKDDKDSWCLETAGAGRSDDKQIKYTPQDFLQPQVQQDMTAYCSFLVQKDTESYERLVGKLLPVQSIDGTDWHYEPCIWIFFGRNNASNDLQGRPEHTDSVSHDGTWHYQLSGRKVWTIRPTGELLEHMTTDSDGKGVWTETTSIRVDCQQSDLLIINTRLWFHQTTIPPQENPSVSYARDFWIQAPGTPSISTNSNDKHNMTNVDGMYATNPIAPGTVIFTEKDMPDGELHRSKTNPNCEVVELEDGINAVVSCRAIASGEFFCVAESSSEEESGDEEEVEYESEEEEE